MGSGTPSGVEERAQFGEVTSKHWDQESFYYIISIPLFSHRKLVRLLIFILKFIV